jgi:membrane-bound serine protease (ClpP class)
MGERRRRAGALLCALLVAVAGLLALASPAPAVEEPGAGESRVLATRLDGAITAVTPDLVREGLAEATAGGYEAYVLELDTPGGLLSATREVVGALLTSPVPVVVYVSPAGGQAASAGTLITMAASVAAMAPGTEIGAATPVDGAGGDLDTKIINDTAAFSESIAEVRGRDVEFAREAVTEGLAVSADAAASRGVVDLVSPSLPALLDAVDGTSADVADGSVVLSTAGAAVDRADPGLLRTVQQFLASPELAFLLLALIAIGLFVEFGSPGLGIGAVTAAVAFVLSLFSLAVLPVQAVGVALLVLALALFAAEVFAPGIGVFAGGGAVSLVLAGLFLFDADDGVRVNPLLVVPTAVVVAVGAVVAGRLALRGRADPSESTGRGALRGRTVEIVEADGSTGRGRLDGTWWSLAGEDDAPLTAGNAGRVVRVDGLTLVVTPTDEHRPTPTEE